MGLRHLLLACAAAATKVASAPAAVGHFDTYTNALPDSQLPHVPLLGNGALGVLLDARNDRHSGAASGRDNTLDVWLASSSFWSCGTCASIAKGCCRVAALGGVSVSLLPTFTLDAKLAFAAEQRVGGAQLAAFFTTLSGGVAAVLVFMHPRDNVVAVNVSWAPGPDDPDLLHFDVSVWVEAASAQGAHPAPASVGCADATTLQPQACAASTPSASAQVIFASRYAATTADTPNLVWAGIAAHVANDGGVGPASFAVISNAAGGAFEAAVSLAVTAATGPVSLLIGEAETRGGQPSGPDPALAAAALVAQASADGVAAAAAAWWGAFWDKSSVSLPSQLGVEAVWAGAQFLLGCTSSTDPDVPPPGLYGVWATSDSCSWNGDFTLDYNAEATFFGAFSSNRAAQAASYYQFLLDWLPFGREMAQQQARALGITCDASAVHYACHLAPWGYQSFDETFYMHWNGHYSTLLFINAFEYTLDAAFARNVVYPYLDAHNGWWACSLNKTLLPDGSYVYRDTRADAEHEGQVVPDPQIGLAFAARTIRAQLDIAKVLGLAPPPLLVDIDAHLVAFNTANWSWTPPPANASNVSFIIYENQRFSDDSGMHLGVATLEECEALCATLGACDLFTFCPNTTVPTCDDGESCWQYTSDKLATLHAGPGFTSGRKNSSAAPAVTLTVWSAFAAATVGQSDSFAIYPLWPSEFLASSGAPLDAVAASVAQASARAYVNFDGGRTVDVFSSAVLAGLGFVFAPARGGSVVRAGPAAPAYAFSPAEVLSGFADQIRRLFGGNLLLYAPGGGVENIGVSRAINDMLATSVGGLGGVVQVFPFWPATESASYAGLLVKGGFEVTASYSNVTGAVASPVVITAAYTLIDAATAVVRLADPWGVGPTAGITATCDGVATPVSWPRELEMRFVAPAQAVCVVALP